MTITVEGQKELPPVLGEAHEISQIFLNLLLNAVDASRPGGEVRVEFSAEGSEVVAWVQDDGAGMTPEVAARAFDHFFTTKEAGKGTGLGLAMVRSLVQALDGSIRFETEPGKGTRFEVRFPRPSEPPSLPAA